MEEYDDIFQPPGEPISRAIDHRIELENPAAAPPKTRLYRMSEDEQQAVKKTLDEYIANGWIRPSTSPYGAPVIVIRKKTGELRIVIDYRLLNKQTRLDSYPIPRIDELLDRLGKAKFFTKIDLSKGYHQIRMAPGHEAKTAFMTRFGTFEWLVLPLGLTNAPATF